MLKCWHIENFKAIVDSGDLKLAPVTVFAGLNSSGKSSLLQSILMISQTLRDHSPERALLLNGPTIQLGSFNQIISNYTENRQITARFELAENKKLELNKSMSISVSSTFRKANPYDEEVELIEASFLGLENANSTIDNKFGLNFSKNLGVDYNELFMDVVNVDDAVGDINDYEFSGTIVTKDPIFDSDYELSVFLTVNHFLPKKIIAEYYLNDYGKGPYEFLRDELEVIFWRFIKKSDADSISLEELLAKPFDFNIFLPEELKKDINALSKEFGGKDFDGQKLIDLLIWERDSIKPIKDKEIEIEDIGYIPLGTAIETIMKHLEYDIISSYKGEDVEYLRDTELTLIQDAIYPAIQNQMERIKGFFSSDIRYLGPLRLDPKEPQRYSNNSELGDVGSKGEYAAVVYDSKKNTNISWYNPNTNEIVNSPLQEALNSWVRYLKVADEIMVKPEGHNGYSWQVRQAINYKPVPLAAVGVGVSQILPILVTGLLSPKDCLLIIEQPELHLHPRVQSLLGDFFMSLAKCGKQCLIETHSENLVNRLRLHIVKAGGMDKSDCLIYFAHQEPDKGAIFEPVEISPKGNIMNWPEGFFDVTIQQEEEILFENLKRRASNNA